MEDIGRLLGESDFSKETDLQKRLFGRLFESRRQEDKTLRFTRISDDDLTKISAAYGVPDYTQTQEFLRKKLWPDTGESDKNWN